VAELTIDQVVALRFISDVNSAGATTWSMVSSAHLACNPPAVPASIAAAPRANDAVCTLAKRPRLNARITKARPESREDSAKEKPNFHSEPATKQVITKTGTAKK